MQAYAADGLLVGSDGAEQLQGADGLQRLGLLRRHSDGGGEVVTQGGFSHRLVSTAANDEAPPAAPLLLLLLALGFGWARLGLLADLEPLLPEVDEHLVSERRLVLLVQLPQDGLVGLQVRPELLELLDQLVLVLGHLEWCWSEDRQHQSSQRHFSGPERTNQDQTKT